MTRQHFETYHFTYINSIAVYLVLDTVNAVTIGVHEPNMAYHWIFDMSNKTDVSRGTCRNSLLFPSTWGGVRVAHFLHVCVVFCESLIFPLFSFAHCIIFSYSNYGFWLTVRYLQTALLFKLFLSYSPGSYYNINYYVWINVNTHKTYNYLWNSLQDRKHGQ